MLETIRKELADGIIGEPTMLTANLGYVISQVPRLRRPELAGGALLDVGVYPLNFALMIFGGEVAKVSSVCTYTDTGVDLSLIHILSIFEYNEEEEMRKIRDSEYKSGKEDGIACGEADRKSTRLNSSHSAKSRMPSSA